MVEEVPEIPPCTPESATTPITVPAPAPTDTPESAPTEAPTPVTDPPKRSFFGRLLGGEGRIPAFDLARGLAIIGMFTAHILTFDGNLPQTIVGISHGRSAALFAFLAGISLGIIAGREHLPTGVKLLQTRMRVVTRALILLVIVTILAMYNMGIILILGFYAAWFLFALPFLGWNARKLLILGGGLIVIGTPLSSVLIEILTGMTLQTTTAESAAYIYLLSGNYGGAGFLGYIFIGLALARLGIASDSGKARKLAKKALAAGCVLFLLGAGGATLIDSLRIGHLSTSVLGAPGWHPSGSGSLPPEEPEPAPSPTVFPPETGDIAGKPIPPDCYCSFPAPKPTSTSGDTENTSEGTSGKDNLGKKDAAPTAGTLTPEDVNNLPHSFRATNRFVGDISPDAPPAWWSVFSGWSPEDFGPDFWYRAFLDGEPHSNSLLETLGNLGFSLIIVSLFLLGGRVLAMILFPVATMGSMALTIYCLHVFWLTFSTLATWPHLPSYLAMLAVFAVFSSVWRFWWGRGPLERLLHWASHRAARVDAGS